MEVHFNVEASVIKNSESKKGDILVFRIRHGTKDDLKKAYDLVIPLLEDKSKVHALFITEMHEIEIINLIEKEAHE